MKAVGVHRQVSGGEINLNVWRSGLRGKQRVEKDVSAHKTRTQLTEPTPGLGDVPRKGLIDLTHEGHGMTWDEQLMPAQAREILVGEPGKSLEPVSEEAKP